MTCEQQGVGATKINARSADVLSELAKRSNQTGYLPQLRSRPKQESKSGNSGSESSVGGQGLNTHKDSAREHLRPGGETRAGATVQGRRRLNFQGLTGEGFTRRKPSNSPAFFGGDKRFQGRTHKKRTTECKHGAVLRWNRLEKRGRKGPGREEWAEPSEEVGGADRRLRKQRVDGAEKAKTQWSGQKREAKSGEQGAERRVRRSAERRAKCGDPEPTPSEAFRVGVVSTIPFDSSVAIRVIYVSSLGPVDRQDAADAIDICAERIACGNNTGPLLFFGFCFYDRCVVGGL